MQFFRNITLFRFPAGTLPDTAAIAAALQEHALIEPGPLELASAGFVPPLGRAQPDFTIHGAPSFLLFALGEAERILPTTVVADELAERIDAIAQQEGRRVGGKERQRIKDAVTTELLPRAFIRTRVVRAYFDLAGRWLVIDTASRKAAEAVVSALREAFGRFPAIPMSPDQSPRAILTGWLATNPEDGYLLGEEVELRDPAEAGSLVRARNQDLEADEIREHLTAGKQVFRLGLTWRERLSFVLDEALVLRKLRMLDVVLDQLDEEDFESTLAQTQGSLMLLGAEVSPLCADLTRIFGLGDGERPNIHLDGGPVPASMRHVTARELASAHSGDIDSVEIIAPDGAGATLTSRSRERLRAHATRLEDMAREEADSLYTAAVAIVRESGTASIAGLQRKLNIGYNATARLLERMEADGIVSPLEGSVGKKVVMTRATK